MNFNSKIYLAGHTGLVGSAILKMLQSNGYKNIITRSIEELNLTRQDQTEKIFEQEQPEYVFLAAAKVGGILANNTYKAEFIYDNLMIATNVIHASYKYKVKKLLNLDSDEIFKPEDIETIISFVKNKKGDFLAKNKAESFISKAKAALSIFPPHYIKEDLFQLADFVVKRNY